MPALDNWDWGVVLPDRSILISELGGNDANLSLVHLPKGSATVSKQVFLSAFLLQLPVVAPNGRFLALADFPVEERGGRVVVLDTKSWKVVFECSGESVTWLSKEELLIGRDADSTIYSGQNSLSKKGIWRVEFKSGRVEHIWPRGN